MSYELIIEPTGQSVEIEDGQTVLDAALRAGIYLPHVCGHGLCSHCKVDVLEGEVDHGAASPFALMEFEREEGKALACCCTAQSDIVIEADIDEDPDALCIPVRDFSGRVEKLDDLTHDIKGVTIVLEGEGMAFQPGQYINLTLPGIDGARAYSIANVPSKPNRIELHIRKVEGGQASSFVHDQLKEGDEVSLAGPFGQFFVRKSAEEPMIFLAGGSGLSSPKSMILDLLEEGCTKPITLFHGVRGENDIYDHDLFEGLAAEHDNFEYIPVLSEPNGSGWDGETGFVHEALQRRFDGHFAGHKAYLCGPPPMIEACVTALMQGRLFERDIYAERFLSKADGEASKSPLFKKI